MIIENYCLKVERKRTRSAYYKIDYIAVELLIDTLVLAQLRRAHDVPVLCIVPTSALYTPPHLLNATRSEQQLEANILTSKFNNESQSRSRMRDQQSVNRADHILKSQPSRIAIANLITIPRNKSDKVSGLPTRTIYPQRDTVTRKDKSTRNNTHTHWYPSETEERERASER